MQERVTNSLRLLSQQSTLVQRIVCEEIGFVDVEAAKRWLLTSRECQRYCVCWATAQILHTLTPVTTS